MEDNSEITLDQLTGEAQRLLNLRQDSNLISNTAHEVNAVRKNETKQQNIKGGGKEAKAMPQQHVIQLFPSLFSNELGRCDKTKISLQLEDDVNPVFRPKRPVAYAMQSMVEDELTRLEHNFGNADILSRLMDRHEKPEEDYVIASIQLEDDINHLVTSATQALPLNFKDLERGTQADPLLRKVFQFVQNGWPKGEEKTEDLKQFFARREALSTVGKCLLYGERVVVPANLRNRVLKLLHKGHPGVCRMKALARGYVYWPKFDSEIENAVKTCQSCASAAKSPEHCIPVDWPKTTGSWQRIYVDYAGPMEGEYYFLVVDSYSKWPEIIPTRQTTAQATVQMLRGLCARFGIPETVVSDSGTQFTSSKFRDFCMENGIHHVQTAPYHPQSNGQAESEKNQNQNQKKSQGIFVNHVTKNTAKRKFISIIINGITTSLQLDTASDITVISKTTWQHLGQPKLSQASIEASNASGEQLKLIGEFECEVILNAITEKCVCFVTSSPVLNVIGIDWIDRFNLWAIPFDVLCKKVSSACPKDRIVQLQSKYPTVFDDSLGHCTKTKVKLFLKPNVKPVFCPKRPVPFNTIALVDAELSRLQSLGIITPIDFSEWAAPIVAIRKPNGKVRICADYSTGLNEALESNHYPLPTPEEIFAQLNGSVVFSIVDLSDAYLQVEVEDESKHLLTINTHRGLFQFNRLAPGVKSAPGAFQRLVDGMIADIPGVRTFLDDAIIFGKTWEAHKQSLDTFLQRLKEYGFHVKLEKCHFYQTEIVYLGHVVDRNGIRPDPEKLKTIASIPAPTNISELRSFLGAVNFYGRFVRNMHELRHPLDQLLKKDTKWKWNSDCQTSFEKFKKVLQSDLLLTHYDPNLPIIVAADASSTGVGAVIFHKFPNGYLKAIQHASRTLTSAEQGYGQPEKEALALTYGVTNFISTYLVGNLLF
ncbi:uncharacterized protein K02A2.6-like [Anopheles merus]|uniref:uncharacterized protein K02A2.6-like n=1 Tax=Anopheles merus TaxID=30066 RepID=UPI001BE4A220|nr:uncharacterized protein K02A2.6-like [Anopheles merus]